jgi:hypothetical protein
MIDPTTTPTHDEATGFVLCTIEDASMPGQEFPCMWNAQTQGNGEGCSFIVDFQDDVPHYVTDVLADGSVLTDDAGCAPYSGEEGFTEQVAPPVTLTEPVAEPVAQVLTAPAPAPALADTGIDPSGALVAALMVVVGIVLVRTKRAAR